MNVVDSSGWIAWLTGEGGAPLFAEPLSATASLLVPVISLFEVYRYMLNIRGEDGASAAAAFMRTGTVIDLDESLAIDAARLGQVHRLAMADSIILATARRHAATLWTQDADFDGLDGVRYFPREATT